MSIGETPKRRERRERVETFLEGQGYPRKPPYDPDRMLWCSLVKMPDGQGWGDVPREVISIRPASDPMPTGLGDGENYAEVSKYPMLVMPRELDFRAMQEE